MAKEGARGGTMGSPTLTMAGAGDQRATPEPALPGPPLSLPPLALGGNNFGVRLDLAGTKAVVAAALDLGVTFFDTADAYGEGESERLLGRLLEHRRDRVLLATKFGWGAGHGDGVAHGAGGAIRPALEASLRRLRTDYVDVYYYHRHDGVTPVGETLGALGELVDAGLVRSAACSNFDAAQLLDAADAARASSHVGFAAVQNEYNLLRPHGDDVVRLCRELGILFAAYRPLAQGLLTGKHRLGAPPAQGTRLCSRPEAIADGDLAHVERLQEYAAAHDRSVLDLALGALVSRADIACVVIGAMSAQQLRANVEAAARRLTPASSPRSPLSRRPDGNHSTSSLRVRTTGNFRSSVDDRRSPRDIHPSSSRSTRSATGQRALGPTVADYLQFVDRQAGEGHAYQYGRRSQRREAEPRDRVRAAERPPHPYRDDPPTVPAATASTGC